jgi:hypothetical protein
MTTDVTITVSLAHIIYLSGCLGFILGVVSLWGFVEIWKAVRAALNRRREPPTPPGGRHRVAGTQPATQPARPVRSMVAPFIRGVQGVGRFIRDLALFIRDVAVLIRAAVPRAATT